jgi:hypothetical protein
MDYLVNTAQARDYRYTEQLALAAIPVVARWCNGIPYGWPTMRSWQLKAKSEPVAVGRISHVSSKWAATYLS